MNLLYVFPIVGGIVILVIGSALFLFLRLSYKSSKRLQDMYLRDINEGNIVEHLHYIAGFGQIHKILGSRANFIRVWAKKVVMNNGKITGHKTLMNELCLQVLVEDIEGEHRNLIIEQDSGDWVFQHRHFKVRKEKGEFIPLPFIDLAKENGPPKKSNLLNEGGEFGGFDVSA